MQRTQVEGGLSYPVRQRRTIELNTLAGVNLRLPVERQVIGIFGDQDLGSVGRPPSISRARLGLCSATPGTGMRRIVPLDVRDSTFGVSRSAIDEE